jgi:hypothetical protein
LAGSGDDDCYSKSIRVSNESKYKFRDQKVIYFVTFTVIHWLDVSFGKNIVIFPGQCPILSATQGDSNKGLFIDDIEQGAHFVVDSQSTGSPLRLIRIS